MIRPKQERERGGEKERENEHKVFMQSEINITLNHKKLR